MSFLFGGRSGETPGEKLVEGMLGDPITGLSISGRVKAMMRAQDEAMKIGASSPWAATGVGPLHKEARPKNCFGFGPADNAGIVGALGGKGGSLPMSILRNLDIAPFTRNAMKESHLDLSGFIVASGICSLRSTSAKVRKQLLMQETMVPFLPKDQAMEQDASQEELRKLLSNTTLLADQIWFVDSIRTARKEAKDDSEDRRILLKLGEDFKWSDDATLEDQVAVMVVSGKYLPEQGRTRCLYTILLCLVSFALRGEISQQKLSKMQTELTVMMPGVAEQLSREDISLTWRNFGHLINDTTAAIAFRRWLGFIPAPIIRVRVCLAQAAGSGMTSLDIIARAIHEHPTFPWYLVIRTYPEEWRNAVRAITLVGDNPYFGYRGNMSEIRSTRYKSVTWVCWKLLVECGDSRLADYRGIVVDNQQKDAFENIIRGYQRAKPGPDLIKNVEPEEVGELPDLINLVSQYPANTGTLMSMVGHDPDVDDILAGPSTARSAPSDS